MSLVSQPSTSPAVLTSMFNRSEISQQSGSEHVNFALLCVDGYTKDSNVIALPVIKTFSPKDDTDIPAEQSAENNTYYLKGGKHVASIETEFMQQGAGTKMFYKDFGGLKGMFNFEEHKTDVAGVYQCMFVPNAMIDQKGDRTSPGLGMKQNILVMPSAADISISMAEWTEGFNNTCLATTGVSIPKNTYVSIIEYSATAVLCVH
jgi:hypothetical protein